MHMILSRYNAPEIIDTIKEMEITPLIFAWKLIRTFFWRNIAEIFEVLQNDTFIRTF